MFAMSLLALGCGGAPAAGPANVAVGVGGWAPTLAVSAADIGGVLGFARLTDRDAVGMMPQGEGAVVVWPVRAGVAVDSLARTTTLLGPSGDPVRGQLGAPTTIPHGCDGGTIEVVPITPEGGQAIAGGVVWALPEPLPTGWAPAAVALEPGEATTSRATWTAGPLTITSATTSKTVGALTVRAGDQVLGELPYERGTMDDDPDASIDLSGDHHNPGVPRPAAAWLLAPEGPMLLATYTESFEGSGVSAYLIGETSLAEVEALSDGYYYCAY